MAKPADVFLVVERPEGPQSIALRFSHVALAELERRLEALPGCTERVNAFALLASPEHSVNEWAEIMVAALEGARRASCAQPGHAPGSPWTQAEALSLMDEAGFTDACMPLADAVRNLMASRKPRPVVQPDASADGPKA